MDSYETCDAFIYKKALTLVFDSDGDCLLIIY